MKFLGFFFGGLFILATGCSTAKVQSVTPKDSAADLKTREYEELKTSISQYHDSSFFGPDKPWIFTLRGTDPYFIDFSKHHCQGNNSIDFNACKQMFSRTVNSVLSQTYFAANPEGIKQKCAEDPLICGDLQTVEVLFRNLHNASVKQSKQEKLDLIEDWKSGKITNDELEAALHIRFRFENNQLILTLPGEHPAVSQNI